MALLFYLGQMMVSRTGGHLVSMIVMVRWILKAKHSVSMRLKGKQIDLSSRSSSKALAPAISTLKLTSMVYQMALLFYLGQMMVSRTGDHLVSLIVMVRWISKVKHLDFHFYAHMALYIVLDSSSVQHLFCIFGWG